MCLPSYFHEHWNNLFREISQMLELSLSLTSVLGPVLMAWIFLTKLLFHMSIHDACPVPLLF